MSRWIIFFLVVLAVTLPLAYGKSTSKQSRDKEGSRKNLATRRQSLQYSKAKNTLKDLDDSFTRHSSKDSRDRGDFQDEDRIIIQKLNTVVRQSPKNAKSKRNQASVSRRQSQRNSQSHNAREDLDQILTLRSKRPLEKREKDVDRVIIQKMDTFAENTPRRSNGKRSGDNIIIIKKRLSPKFSQSAEEVQEVARTILRRLPRECQQKGDMFDDDEEMDNIEGDRIVIQKWNTFSQQAPKCSTSKRTGHQQFILKPRQSPSCSKTKNTITERDRIVRRAPRDFDEEDDFFADAEEMEDIFNDRDDQDDFQHRQPKEVIFYDAEEMDDMFKDREEEDMFSR